MKLWGNTGMPVDRSRGEGPPPCCNVAIVASDELAWCGGLPPATLATLSTAVPRWQSIPPVQLYICGSCREHLFRHKLLSREEWARGNGLSRDRIAAAWVHDEQFWRRGPSSAPAEVQAQAWWLQYQAAWTTALTQIAQGKGNAFQGLVQTLLRGWAPQ